MSSPSLPPPSINQAYINVSALEAGIIYLPSHKFIMGASPSDVIRCPSLAFLLRHSRSNAQVVFDLGIRKDVENYPPAVEILLKEMPVEIPQDVSESLEKGGIRPADVETVVVSHLHFDHIGDCAPFTKATFLTGEASEELLNNGYPSNPESGFHSDSIPRDRTRFLTKEDYTASIANFPHALDFFGDGSLYIIDSPGHLSGHVNVLARTSEDGSWIYLGGDTCHDVRLLTGERLMFFKVDASGKVISCMHVDKDKAQEHINRVGELMKLKEVHVLVAHDWEWYEHNKGGSAFLPGTIPPIQNISNDGL